MGLFAARKKPNPRACPCASRRIGLIEWEWCVSRLQARAPHFLGRHLSLHSLRQSLASLNQAPGQLPPLNTINQIPKHTRTHASRGGGGGGGGGTGGSRERSACKMRGRIQGQLRIHALFDNHQQLPLVVEHCTADANVVRGLQSSQAQAWDTAPGKGAGGHGRDQCSSSSRRASTYIVWHSVLLHSGVCKHAAVYVCVCGCVCARMCVCGCVCGVRRATVPSQARKLVEQWLVNRIQQMDPLTWKPQVHSDGLVCAMVHNKSLVDQRPQEVCL